jgi:O-glycosyl hydrolase
VNVTNGGNGLCPDKVDDFAQWLVQAIKDYQKIGIDLYALSFQNEPCFFQPYNSSYYHIDYYREVLKKIVPVIKAASPKIKIFGAEQMLEEVDNDKNSFGFACGGQYTKAIKDDPAALAQLDAFAWHGYSDGVQATASSRMAKLWQRAYDDFSPTQKAIWMTETSGYVDDWADEKKGPLNLAQAIYAGLYYGKMSAWVWWQGSRLGEVHEEALMQGLQHRGGRYYVSKNFYRYVRPGMQMVDVQSRDKNAFVTAFLAANNAMTVVAVNPTGDNLQVSLEGNNVPGSFNIVCQSSAKQDCVKLGKVSSKAMTLPAKSVTTFVSGTLEDM